MAPRGVTIDGASAIDNPAERQVEFRAEANGAIHHFAIKYSVLDAMSGDGLLDEPAAAFPLLADRIAAASLRALGAARGKGRIVIDEWSAGTPGTRGRGRARGEREAHPG